MNLEKLFRADLHHLKAYSSARSLGLNATYFLDANEGVLGLAENNVSSYPMPRPLSLIETLANYYQCESEQISLLRGSDEGIDLLIRLLVDLKKEEGIAAMAPSYGVYKVQADIHGCSTMSLPIIERDGLFELDMELLHQRWSPHIKVLFLCSPNNPTGSVLAPSSLEQLMTFLQGRSLVVVDEAYQEYSRYPSFLSKLATYPNLCVLRTLSKAWSMAGLRLGCVLGNPQLISWLEKIRAPYPIPTPCYREAELMLKEQKEMQQSVQETIEEREALMEFLRSRTWVERVYPSQANFILFSCATSNELFSYLLERGLLVRNFHSLLPQHLRVSVGSSSVMKILVQALEEYRP